jgi:ubiquitin-like-conjugating enzyme ATG10
MPTSQVHAVIEHLCFQDRILRVCGAHDVTILFLDGQSISLEDIFESLVPEDWRSTIRNAGLNGGISQHDHPILNVPYFYMHPCETVSLMETTFCQQASENSLSFLEGYIASWLSLTGQAIGITLPATLAANNTGSLNV